MFHGFEKEKCKCNKWKAVTGFQISFVFVVLYLQKKLVINNKVMLNNSRIHFQVSSIFSKEYHQILQMTNLTTYF